MFYFELFRKFIEKFWWNDFFLCDIDRSDKMGQGFYGILEEYKTETNVPSNRVI
jgi:hypothetical protein